MSNEVPEGWRQVNVRVLVKVGNDPKLQAMNDGELATYFTDSLPKVERLRDEVERLRDENERLQRLVLEGVEHVLRLMDDLGLPSPEDYARQNPVNAPKTRTDAGP